MLSGSAAATPPTGEVVRTDLAKGATDTPISIVTQGETAFYVQRLQVMPGASSGWHSHPGVEYSIVTKGTLHVQDAATCEIVAYSAGQILFAPAGTVHQAVNHGPEQAETLSTFTVPAELPAVADAPAACQ
jgi:quercetin dioxygenase-like cupin family protein